MTVLTKAHRELIEENYEQIQLGLTKAIKAPRYEPKYRKRFGGNVNDAIFTGLSHLAELSTEYDPSKTDQNFTSFATQRCLQRLSRDAVDQKDITRTHRAAKIRSFSRNDMDSQYKQTGTIDPEQTAIKVEVKFDVERKTARRLVTDSQRVIWSTTKSNDGTNASKAGLYEIACHDVHPTHQMVWEEIKKCILDNMEEEFHKDNKTDRLSKMIITDYLIPHAEGGVPASLVDIASCADANPSLASIVLRSDKMMKFLKRCGIDVPKKVKKAA